MKPTYEPASVSAASICAALLLLVAGCSTATARSDRPSTTRGRRHPTTAASTSTSTSTTPPPSSVAGVGTSTGTTPGCTRDASHDERYVDFVYRALLGHGATRAQTTFWAALFPPPTRESYAGLITHLTGSSAYHTARIDRLYRRIEGRAPTAAEMRFWTVRLERATTTDLAVDLLADEPAGSGPTTPTATWLTRLYHVVLSRKPDAAGTKQWTQALGGGHATRADIARQIWLSAESRGIRVTRLARRLLGHHLDARHRRYWTAQLGAHGLEWVIIHLLTTDGAWNAAQGVTGDQATPMPPPCPVPVWPDSPKPVFDLQDYPEPGNVIALTFDDGPDPRWTPQILDLLKREGVPATFFTVGEEAQRFPDLIRQELADGNSVAIHTWSHPNLDTLRASDIQFQLGHTKDVVNAIAGRPVVHCYRPPYGNHDATADHIAAALDLQTVMWSRDTRDWAEPGVPAIVANARSTALDGGRGINLMHDGGGNRSQTVAALSQVIAMFRAQGYHFVKIC